MSSFLQKAMLYLGLVDEEVLDEDQAVGRPEPQPRGPTVPTQQVRTLTTPEPPVRGRRVEPPADSRRPMGVAMAASTDVEIVEDRGFDDAKIVADRIRARRPVVLDLRTTDPDMVRRLVDFASGLTYGLDGTMRKIAEGVILVLPARVSLGREEQRRLAELGLYAVED
jgi:cell division inhibitor SepF